MAKRASSVRIGISGWRYVPWRGVFYPKDLAQKRELEYASRVFNTIELNGSFYSLQRPENYRAWREATPEGFVFSIKGSRFITHMRKLKDVATPLANFLASGILALNEKLGPFLWQFPPQFGFDENRFKDFFRLLPRTTAEAAKLARRHDERLKGRAWTKSDADRPLRHAVEIRHETFRDERFIRLLRQWNVALVVADTGGKWPHMEDVTSDFAYVRLHGPEELYASGYTDQGLDWWADRINAWREGGEPPDSKKVSPAKPKKIARDVYVYFDNDVKVRAPFDAAALYPRVGLPDPGIGRNPLELVPDVPRGYWPAPRK